MHIFLVCSHVGRIYIKISQCHILTYMYFKYFNMCQNVLNIFIYNFIFIIEICEPYIDIWLIDVNQVSVPFVAYKCIYMYWQYVAHGSNLFPKLFKESKGTTSQKYYKYIQQPQLYCQQWCNVSLPLSVKPKTLKLLLF